MKNRSLLLLLLLFCGLALLNNFLTPLFEAPDEFDHFSYAHWLATGHGLPNMAQDRGQVGEIWQPPLYYALLAPFIAILDTSDWQTVAPFNPYWPEGGGVTAHYHTPAEAFPYQQTTLAVHLARLLSTVLGCLTIVATHKIAQAIAPPYGLLAAAMVALNPQFIFMSAVINNDNLITALSSLTLWAVVWGIGQESPGRSQAILLGLLWGLATLAKLTGLTLGGVIFLGLAYQGWQQNNWRPAVTNLLLAGLTAGFVAGWYFWLNWWRYGDPLAWAMILEVTQGLLRPEPLSWLATLEYATFIRFTFWASFGYGALAPPAFYWLVQAACLLAGVGLLHQGWKHRSQWRLGGQTAIFLLLAAWAVVVLLVLLRWMRLVTTTNQGRLLFPAISCVAVGLAVGLAAWNRGRLRPGQWFAGLLALWAIVLPFLVIGPTYSQPKPAQAPHNLTPITFGSQLQLLGYELPQTSPPAGQPFTVDLYWQALQPMSESYVIAIRLLDSSGRVVSGLDTIPYAGRYPTPVWQVGQPFQDSYTLPAPVAGYHPGRANLLVTLYPWGQPNSPLPSWVGENQLEGAVTIASLKLAPAGTITYTPTYPLAVTFGQQAKLLGYDLSSGRPLSVTLYWQALQPDGLDYTVFVHLLDPAGNVIAQADSPPQNNAYPTSLWATDEQIADPHFFELPPNFPAGNYQLLIGLYRPETGQRLPTTPTQPNDALLTPPFPLP